MNKRLMRTLTVLFAALLLMCGTSMTAFAQGTDETDDSGVIYEETEEYDALTPDGNASLVDDYGGNKQLITITTKNGNYFYIIIDRDDEGEQTVHFLNQVDEADLMALMEEEETTVEETPAVCTCTEKCKAGEVDTACAVCSIDYTKCAGTESEPEVTEEEPEEESGGMGALLLLLAVALLGGGGAFYYLKFMKPKQDVKGSTDLDDFDFDDYDEDEPEPDDTESADNEETEE
ncbi:MAG: DUF4366 domain-containing protein [Lachnospiraceae bacterium]|nr:DUF4366 domain-containing protein [Lachnospiraceae bacterium]